MLETEFEKYKKLYIAIDKIAKDEIVYKSLNDFFRKCLRPMDEYARDVGLDGLDGLRLLDYLIYNTRYVNFNKEVTCCKRYLEI